MDLREQLILDRASDLFQEDSDTLEALEDFVRGFKSANELKERLEFLAECAHVRAADQIDNEEREKAECA